MSTGTTTFERKAKAKSKKAATPKRVGMNKTDLIEPGSKTTGAKVPKFKPGKGLRDGLR